MTAYTIRAAGMLLAAAALVLSAPASGRAGNNGQLPSGVANSLLVGQIQAELKTATSRARELAQQGTTLAGVQLYLNHVVNCLEGPQAGYANPSANPCRGQGKGIIPDLQMAVLQNLPGARAAIQEAQTSLTLALQALQLANVASARSAAVTVSKHLETANKYIGE
jgi:hypothetical protein